MSFYTGSRELVTTAFYAYITCVDVAGHAEGRWFDCWAEGPGNQGETGRKDQQPERWERMFVGSFTRVFNHVLLSF